MTSAIYASEGEEVDFAKAVNAAVANSKKENFRDGIDDTAKGGIESDKNVTTDSSKFDKVGEALSDTAVFVGYGLMALVTVAFYVLASGRAGF